MSTNDEPKSHQYLLCFDYPSANWTETNRHTERQYNLCLFYFANLEIKGSEKYNSTSRY